jgi:hypothetical protein
MTTTAKILVVLNLLLAVLFLGFAASSFNARLGMQTKITSLEKEKKASDDKAAVERSAAEKAAVEIKETSTKLSLEQKSKNELKKQTDNALENLGVEAMNYKKQVDIVNQRIKQVADEATMRKQEIDQAREQNKDLVAKNVKAQNELSASRDEIQELKSQIERLDDKIRINQEKHRKVLNYLASVKVTLPPETEMEGLADATQPPNVEGVVKQVSDNGKALTISLGENDGLKLNHRLLIFRRHPEAKYIGEAEVTLTKPNEAVLRPTEPYTAPPKVGDRVGISSLLHRG